jgi:ankyrin repeat protein
MTFSANANFHGAIEEGAIRHVEKYLNVGEDVNAQGREGRAALHCAVLAISKLINDNHYESRRYELFRIAELLIVKGADVNAKDNEGRTPLDYTESIPPSGRQYPAEIADLLRL